MRISNSLKEIQSSKNQADSSFATQIRDENLDKVMMKLYNETIWTKNQRKGYVFADEGECV